MSNSKVKIAPPDSEMYNWSDPRRVGPGVWYMFMLMSAHAEHEHEKAAVCAQIRLFCDHFKCGDCSGHCKEYLSLHPPEEAIKGKDSLFDWVITFMNSVQHRLKKPLYDIHIMKKLFTHHDFKFCSADCGQNKPPSAVTHSRSQSRADPVRPSVKRSVAPSRNIYRPVATNQARSATPVHRQRVVGVMQSAFRMDRI